MRFVIGIGEVIAVVGALGAIAKLSLWGIQWGRKRARRNEMRRRDQAQRMLPEATRADPDD